MKDKTFYRMHVWYKYMVQDSFIQEYHEHMNEDTLELLQEYYNGLFRDGVYASLRIEYEMEVK